MKNYLSEIKVQPVVHSVRGPVADDVSQCREEGQLLQNLTVKVWLCNWILDYFCFIPSNGIVFGGQAEDFK